MSEQFAAKIKNFLKDNVVGFVFLIIIAFFGFSVWVNTQSTSQQTNQLITFANSSLPQIRTKFESISEQSKFTTHTADQYDQVIADFKELDELLQNLSQKIPTESNDVTSDKLENKLRDFFFQTRVDVASNWIEMLKTRQKLVTEYNLAAQLKKTVEQGNAADLQNVVNASRVVTQFERQNLKMIKDLNSQKAKNEQLDADLSRFGAIQGILNRLSEGAELSPEMRAEIAALYAKTGWPLEISVFPGIAVNDLETANFTSDVLILRDLTNQLQEKYPTNDSK